MIVQSFGSLKALTDPVPTWGSSSGSLNLHGLNQTYARIYATQPNVRICVDFLARNIAELGWPVYRRISDTDRERLVDHDLATWMAHPNPSTSQYRLVESLIADLGIYFNAYWVKVRYVTEDGRDAIGLVRLPPDEMRVDGGLLPTKYVWTSNGREKDFPLSEVVYFNGYNPLHPLMGLSPLETLRRILSEEAAASANRESYWRNSSRMEGVIERPKDAPRWTATQKDSWREQWQEFSHGAKAGMVPVLEDGMTFKQSSFSAKDSEYVLGGKLRREVVAAAYHIPQPMVGILEHATFSNIREQHKHLYQDCLGPWLRLVKQEIERQLLIECDDQDRVYLEANIDAKLAGTPEERAQSIQMSTGRPWRTVNEARALENLPRIDDPELDTVAPQQGGPAERSNDPQDPTPADEQSVAAVIQATQARQRAKLDKIDEEERAAVFLGDLERWNRELTADLTPLLGEAEAERLASDINARTLAQLEGLHV